MFRNAYSDNWRSPKVAAVDTLKVVAVAAMIELAEFVAAKIALYAERRFGQPETHRFSTNTADVERNNLFDYC